MADHQMSVSDREMFLAGRHVGVLAIERRNGPPIAVPVWYSYEPGGDVHVLTSASSLKGRLAAAAGRATLCAQQEDLPYRYVTIDGPVEIDVLDPDDRAPIEAMAIRYLGDEIGRGYAAQAAADDEIRLRIRPKRWYTVDYGA